MVGYHYGKRPGLSSLSGASFGTGARSEEALRGVFIKRRVYFYPQKTPGVIPQPERVVTGQNVYRATLANIYDTWADPSVLREAEASNHGIFNPDIFEQAVVDAGYDGYLARNHAEDGGVVLLDVDEVPVEFVGTRSQAKVGSADQIFSKPQQRSPSAYRSEYDALLARLRQGDRRVLGLPVMHLATPVAIRSARYKGRPILQSDTMGAIFGSMRSTRGELGEVPDAALRTLPESLANPHSFYLSSERRKEVSVVLRDRVGQNSIVALMREHGNVIEILNVLLKRPAEIEAWNRAGLGMRLGAQASGAESRSTTVSRVVPAPSAPQRAPARSGEAVGEPKGGPSAVVERVSPAPSEVKSVDDRAHEAATSHLNELPQPTDAQKKAGNYKKGHVRIAGMDITIENPAGTRRRPEWPVLPAHYGYIRLTEDRTGEQIDVFIRPGTEPDYEGPVVVVDTNRPSTRRFDEYKVMIGWESEPEAVRALRSAYSADVRDGIMRSVVVFENPEALKNWMEGGNTNKPAADQMMSRSGPRDQGRLSVMQREDFETFAVYDEKLNQVSPTFNTIGEARDWRRNRESAHKVQWLERPNKGEWISATADGRYVIRPGEGGYWAIVDGEEIKWSKLRADAIEALNDRLAEDMADGTVKDPYEAHSVVMQYSTAAVERVVDGWRTLAKNKMLFRFPTSNKKKLEEIVRDLDNEKIVHSVSLGHADEATATWAIIFKNGKSALITNEPANNAAWLDASELDKGSGFGSFLYPVAFTWARNNGFKLVVDPAGLTNINTARRTEQMLSAALKYDDTKMMSPIRYTQGVNDQSLWGWNDDPKSKKDHDKNIAILAITAMNNTFEVVPQAKSAIYNFETRRFEKNGKPLTRDKIAEFAATPSARTKGVGRTSIARAIFTNSLLNDAPGAREFVDGKIAASLVLGDTTKYDDRILQAYSVAGDRFAPQRPGMAKSAVLGATRGAISAARPIAWTADMLNRTIEAAVRVPGRILVKPITSRIYDRITGIGEAFAKTEVGQKVAHGVVSDYGLPEPYIDRRDDRQISIQKELRKSKGMLERIDGLNDAERRVAYLWMNEKPNTAEEQRLMAMLPEQSRQTLAEMKQQIDELGQEAVRLGFLEEETFERNRMAYLHRSYKKWEVENPSGVAASDRVKAIRGDTFKGRGLRDDVALERVPGAKKGDHYVRLEQRAPAAPGALGSLKRVVYFPTGKPIPAAYAGWRNDGVWEVRYMNRNGYAGMWRDLSREERDRLGEIEEVRYAFARSVISMIHDVETAKFLDWVSREYSVANKADVAARGGEIADTSKDSVVTLTAYGEKDWVQVPGTQVKGTDLYKYGALQSRYIPGYLWNDIRSIINLRATTEFGKLYDELIKAWKISKTALSPAVHTNNVMSNFILADLADVGNRDLLNALQIIVDAQRGNDQAQEMLRRYMDSGSELGIPALHEMRREIIEPLLQKLQEEQDDTISQLSTIQAISLAAKGALRFRLSEIRQAGAALAAKRSVKTAAAPFKAMLETYQLEDSVFRMAFWLKEVAAGKSDRDAGNVARRQFLDYRINAPWIQALRRGPFPFLAFTYRAVPLLAEAFANKPWKMMKYASAAYALNALAYAMLGLGAEDEDKERKLLPEEKSGHTILGTPRLMRMPWNDEHDSPVFLDIRRWVPGGDIFDTTSSQGAIPLPSWLSLGGFFALGAEMALNKSMFTGKEIWKKSDTPGEIMVKLMDHVFKFFTPNLPIPNPVGFAADSAVVEKGMLQTYSWKNIQRAGGGATDDFGRELSLPQALSNAAGVKLGTYPADQLRKNLIAKRDAELRDNSETTSRYRRERRRGGLDDAEFAARIAKQNEKAREINRRYAQKLGL